MLIKKHTNTQSKKHSKKPKSHHPIFHFDAILISLPPGTLSNSVNSWKKVAKQGSCNMICSTRACSKVNFFSFPRSCKSYGEKRRRKDHERGGILSSTRTSIWESINYIQKDTYTRTRTQKDFIHFVLLLEQRVQDSSVQIKFYHLCMNNTRPKKERDSKKIARPRATDTVQNYSMLFTHVVLSQCN